MTDAPLCVTLPPADAAPGPREPSVRPEGERHRMARLQIDMLPVGDADAFIVEVQLDGPPEVFLIDGGKDWEDGDRVLRQLDAYYGGRIDHLILSHADVEHAGAVRQQFGHAIEIRSDPLLRRAFAPA